MRRLLTSSLLSNLRLKLLLLLLLKGVVAELLFPSAKLGSLLS